MTTPNDLPSVGTEDARLALSAALGYVERNTPQLVRDEIRSLAAERDELASRVRELEANAARYVFLADALTSGDIYNVLQKGFENFDQDRPPTREEFDAGIDAALNASKDQP